MDIASYLLGKKAGGGGGKGSLKVVVVEELPETGEANTLYLVPRQVSKYRNVFDEYLYIDNDWEMVGTTDIDISGKQDKMQFTTLPTANADNLGKIYQYIGTTNANYTNGYFYICLSDGEATPTYSWTNINVQAGGSGASGVVITDSNKSSAGVIAAVNAEYQKALNDEPYSVFYVYSPTAGSFKLVPMFFSITKSNDVVTYVSLISTYFDRGYSTDHIGKVTLGLTLTDGDITAITTSAYSGFDTGGANTGTIIMAGGTQYISGLKQFSTLPKSSVVPTEDTHLVNKKYVDDSIASTITDALGGNY